MFLSSKSHTTSLIYIGLVLLLSVTVTEAFVMQPKITPYQKKNSSTKVVFMSQNNNDQQKPNFISSFFQTLDDMTEDFFYKRMGNGEIFYGKRKYKPSGKVEGKYNGFGMSDFQKIEATREYKEYKEAQLEEMRWRREMEEIRRSKDNR